MKLRNSKLAVRQLDSKISLMAPLQKAAMPGDGWIKTIRTTINMSLQQMGRKMAVTPQSAMSMERREKQGTITLNTLKEAAKALDMHLVYGFVPLHDSLEKQIERRAYEMATQIVSRTSASMKLEDQENSQARIQEAINDLAEEIKREMPKKLWD